MLHNYPEFGTRQAEDNFECRTQYFREREWNQLVIVSIIYYYYLLFNCQTNYYGRTDEKIPKRYENRTNT